MTGHMAQRGCPAVSSSSQEALGFKASQSLGKSRAVRESVCIAQHVEILGRCHASELVIVYSIKHI